VIAKTNPGSNVMIINVRMDLCVMRNLDMMFIRPQKLRNNYTNMMDIKSGNCSLV
jgi:hypothetical protein